MLNNETQTKEVNTEINDVDLKQEMKELSRVEQSSNTAVPTGSSSDTIYAELSVSYDDPSVLTTKSPELDTVNKYFKGVTDNDEDIENLLYEMIGYSLAKIAKLNKGFILQGNRQKPARASFLGSLKNY